MATGDSEAVTVSQFKTWAATQAGEGSTQTDVLPETPGDEVVTLGQFKVWAAKNGRR